jgi:hypothetical protein
VVKRSVTILSSYSEDFNEIHLSVDEEFKLFFTLSVSFPILHISPFSSSESVHPSNTFSLHYITFHTSVLPFPRVSAGDPWISCLASYVTHFLMSVAAKSFFFILHNVLLYCRCFISYSVPFSQALPKINLLCALSLWFVPSAVFINSLSFTRSLCRFLSAIRTLESWCSSVSIVTRRRIGRLDLDSQKGQVKYFSLHHRIQIDSGIHPGSYLGDIGSSFAGATTAGAWSWSLTSI